MAHAPAVRDEFLNDQYRAVARTAPTTARYIALLTTNPSDEAGTGAVEAAWTGYARQLVTSSATAWTAPAAGTGSNRQISNAAIVNYGTAGSGPTTVTGFAIYDAATGGTFKAWNVLTGGNKVVNNGDPVSFKIGDLVINA